MRGRLLLLLLFLPATRIGATPGHDVAELHEHHVIGDEQKLRFVSVTPQMAAACPKLGVLCFSVPPDAEVTLSKLVGTPWGEIPILRRAPIEGQPVTDEQPWELQAFANLNPRNLPGNVMFIVYDRADPTAVARQAFTALWQATMTPFKQVAVRVVLDPDTDGFSATHSYLFRIVQRLGKRELVLAQGTFRLE